ncbi:WD40 repeat-like protein [Punctularia strigosozonata HHB-11173 SS5]|uniref:WD40 repeat-like protein n=1 Tax=Punctularia strigosozonata (strain HHB-11173) TaxID=741275 RepID=UPI0004417956|nr:WD40 repeat-like protein [Punctularia strigosozonata HHB-11173 SS5]EIN07505.1 WD40 repeat-like protein [Punctularia strigosozonata HHB-11173 SS5]
MDVSHNHERSPLGRGEPRELQDGAAGVAGVANAHEMQDILRAAVEAQKESRTGPKASVCDCHSPTARNIVVCIDGTANQFGLKNTNVVELFSGLEKSDDQLTYYNSGIGTFVKDSRTSPRYWRQVFNHTVDMAIAWNFKRIVLDAYRWLSEEYKAGDRIFLFGFSRGAYQIRVLAGMIELVGLLCRGNNAQIVFAYELYISIIANGKRNGLERGQNNNAKDPMTDSGQGVVITDKKDPRYATALCKNFKSTLSQEGVKVHFVGAWDTVSSIGVARGPSLPETTNGMTHVCVFRHALALDELRVKFLPEYANGGAGPVSSARGDATSGAAGQPKGNIKEVWFAGSHSDIGGGNTVNLNVDQFGPALRWMRHEATSCGLRVKPFRGTWRPFQPNLTMSLVWKFVELLPLRRLTYKTTPQSNSEDSQRWPPHLSSPRIVMEGQLIHQSAFELGDYKPRARLPGQVTWSKDELLRKGMLEKDPYLSIDAILEQIIGHEHLSDEDRGVLVMAASRDADSNRTVMGVADAVKKLFDALESTRQDSHRSADDKKLLVRDIVLAFGAFPPLPRHSASGLPERKLRALLYDADSHQAGTPQDVSNIISAFGTRLLLELRGHSGTVIVSVAFPPDGTRIASGSEDRSIRIWAADTGKEVLEPLLGHTGWVRSVAFSPNGGCLASGSYDETVRLWDVETGQQIGEPLRGHTGWVRSVAFSPDGNRIVSGSDDRTLRIWDGQTGQAIGEPLRGHSTGVNTVAFSPDGKHIASGSADRTIRLWDAGTGKAVGDPLLGHNRWVRSVAYSPDGTRVVSASDDETLRIWDTLTGKTVLGPLRGHTDYVRSVAFSPDGKYIVSGSDDRTIRIWDAQTGQTVVGPLEAHTNWVNAVAFSPDAKRVVSGSSDGLVKIWDAEVD